MQTLFNQYSQLLGTTLLHSLWQGLIIYALLRMVLLCIPSATSANKYNIALLALTASVLWPIVTLLIEISKQKPIAHTIDTTFVPLAFTPITNNYPAITTNTLSLSINHYMPYLVVLWFIGIIINSARLLWGWRNIYQIKQTVINDPTFQESIQLISQLLQVPQKVQIFLSDHIDIPCIIGYLKPMVILPTAIITQFSAEQIRSILVHEIAHIRRNDYIINVLQQCIGILFFFNPFTHLINKIIYNEREHSCDDLVLQVTGEPLVYAQTLLQLEENRNQKFQLALAATGKKYHLLNRIKRIMEAKKQASNIRHILAAILLLLGSMGTIAWLNPEIKDGKVTITPAGKLPFLSNLPDTTKKAATKTKHSGSRSVPGKIAFPKPKSANLKAKSFHYNDPELDKLSAEVNKHSQAISKYYDSDEFKKMQADIDKKSAEIQAYFDKRETKELQAKQDKYSQEFQSKWGNADEQDVIYMKYLALFKEFSKYMFTPEYKELDKSLQAKYDIKPVVDPQYPRMHMLDQKNKNYPAYQKELNESAPENVKKLRTEMDDLQKQRKVYNKSPDEQNRELRTLADSMRRTFNNPEITKIEQEMKRLGEAMRDYQNNPEIKKQQQELKIAAEKLKAYTNSPEFKKRMEQLKKVEVYGLNHPSKSGTPEKTEKPGQIENN